VVYLSYLTPQRRNASQGKGSERVSGRCAEGEYLDEYLEGDSVENGEGADTASWGSKDGHGCLYTYLL
jgi:hypothetical protein